MIEYEVEIDTLNNRFIIHGDFSENSVAVDIPSDDKNKKFFIDLFLHKQDIERGIDYLRCISIDKNQTLNEALFIAGLNSCMKCFQHSNSRDKLDQSVIFENEDGLKTRFDHFKFMRDKHFFHDENGMLQATAFLLIDTQEDNLFSGPPSVVWNKALINYYFEGQDLQEIMQFIWKYICNEIDIIGNKILDTYKAHSKNDLLKFPSTSIKLASTNSLKNKR